MRDLIHAIKFGRRREGLELLAGDLVVALKETGVAGRCGVVVPVPLHPLRRLGRGFDQAELLACSVAKGLDRPVVLGAIHRSRWLGPQARARVGTRKSRMKESFAPWWRRRRVRNKAVLLIDDVMSTGATADAAARALLRAGARTVHVGVGAT